MAYTTIDDPSAHFQALTYTGNATNRTLTFDGNSDLQADWFWFKERNASANWHQLYDTSRGIGTSSSKRLFTNATSAEEETSGSGVRGVGTNSVDIGTTPGVNGNTNTLVLWAWKANGGTTSSNTDGSITSTVQANTTAGFSIVTYTGNATAGATVGHGLGKKPDMIIAKNRNTTSPSRDWLILHKAYEGTSAENMRFTTMAVASAGSQASSGWYRTAPTSSVFYLGNGSAGDYSGDTNISGGNMVAYCFAEIEGYSKFGSYTGNGSTDGTFIYTGFTPAFIIYKQTNTGNHWFMQDNKRPSIQNVVNSNLYADLANAEVFNVPSTGLNADFLSNGVKLRGSGAEANTNGGTYIYMAFAEHPFVSSKGVPVTAR